MINDLNFSVIMPTYNQCPFIRRAVKSLLAQDYGQWELIIVDDGSTDMTEEFVADFLSDSRIRYLKNNANQGLANAINCGLDAARHDHIAYLPSDDVYYEGHLAEVASRFREDGRIAVVVSGIEFDATPNPGIVSRKTCKGAIPGYCLQLVQTAHVRTQERWTEREELVSEDLFVLFWRKLTGSGVFAFTQKVTCAWTCHPLQHHKICGEKYGGGLNKYRSYYSVPSPMRFRCTNYKTIDEGRMYARFRDRTAKADGGLRILLVGELAYNPERIRALEEAGHELYGLWAKPRYCYNTVGHLPFGHVEDIAYDGWRERVEALRPDVIYALLSTSAIDIAHEVLTAHTGIPFVWHFKEGPHEAMKDGLWPKLVDLYTFADGRIFLDDEEREWMGLFVPDRLCHGLTMVMDGDYPKRECLDARFSRKLSEADGETHTVNVGRIVGVSPGDVGRLASAGVHFHVYNENFTDEGTYLDAYKNAGGRFFHIHRHCPQNEWVGEFSKYDAGWLHCIDAGNDGDLFHVTWADINLPARITALMAAGLPMIQKNNGRRIFAQYGTLAGKGVCLCYDDIDGLLAQLGDKPLLASVAENVRRQRRQYTFDAHVAELCSFFRKVINHKKGIIDV